MLRLLACVTLFHHHVGFPKGLIPVSFSSVVKILEALLKSAERDGSKSVLACCLAPPVVDSPADTALL